jgi:hypothetical protein
MRTAQRTAAANVRTFAHIVRELRFCLEDVAAVVRDDLAVMRGRSFAFYRDDLAALRGERAAS